MRLQDLADQPFIIYERGSSGRQHILDAVTRGRRVRARALEAPIRPIHSGVLVRRGEKLSASSVRLFDFIRSHFSQ